MRSLLIRVIGTSLSFFLAAYFVAGFQIEQSWQAFVIASLLFVVINAIISPIIKLLLLPINLLTLGLFRWMTNVIVLYLFDIFYDGVTISAYRFSGFSSGLLSLPPLDLSLFWTLVLSSFVISLTYSLFSSLLSSE